MDCYDGKEVSYGNFKFVMDGPWQKRRNRDKKVIGRIYGKERTNVFVKKNSFYDERRMRMKKWFDVCIMVIGKNNKK